MSKQGSRLIQLEMGVSQFHTQTQERSLNSRTERSVEISPRFPSSRVLPFFFAPSLYFLSRRTLAHTRFHVPEIPANDAFVASIRGRYVCRERYCKQHRAPPAIIYVFIARNYIFTVDEVNYICRIEREKYPGGGGGACVFIV